MITRSEKALDSRSRSHEQDFGFPPAAVDVFSGEIFASLVSAPLVGATISVLIRRVWYCWRQRHAHAGRAIVWLLDAELDDDDGESRDEREWTESGSAIVMPQYKLYLSPTHLHSCAPGASRV